MCVNSSYTKSYMALLLYKLLSGCFPLYDGVLGTCTNNLNLKKERKVLYLTIKVADNLKNQVYSQGQVKVKLSTYIA